MKCSKCGTELLDNAKFCKQCGEKVEKAELPKNDVKKDDEIKKEKNETTNQPEQNNFNVNKNSEQNAIKNKIKELWEKLNLFEKISVCLSGIFLIGFLVSLIAGKSVAMVISIIQIIAIVVAFLMEKNIIKTTHKWIKIVIPIICVFLMLAYVSTFSSQKVIDYSNAEDIVWNEMIIGDKLPEPPRYTGYIYSNSDERLSMEIYKVSAKQFYEYIESCKNKGFSVDSDKTEFSYTAYTEDGYKLKLSYSDYSEEMSIELNIPKNYTEIKWSEKEIAKLVPVPKSLLGEIKEDTDKKFNVIISNITLNDYNEYVSLCEKNGFNIDIDKEDKSFSAKNTDSYRFNVEYIGNNVIEITIEEPEYDVDLSVECVENWVFSKYNVKIYIDDNYEDTLTHGTTEDYNLKLSKGTHKIKFINEEDESITGEFTTEVSQNGKIELKLNCYNYEISIESKSNSVVKSEEVKEEPKEEPEQKEEKEEVVEQPKEEEKKEEPATEEKKDSVSYSTNDYENAKKGNTGVYSYIKKGDFYDIYYIIDFDNGFVYYFNEGEDNNWCDKLKIKSGDLNSTLLFTYHDGGDSWDEALYFKYKNQPSILIMEDGNHFQHQFEPTNLDKALKLRDAKKITER